MRVLVTGGTGFLGHAVTLDLVSAGHQVDILTRGQPRTTPAGANLVVGDIRDRARLGEIIQTGGYGGVVHLAAVTSGRDSLTDPLTYFDVNAGGTLNLLMAIDTARYTGKPPAFVFTSTNIVYGSTHTGALSEDLEPHPENPYAASKLTAEQMVAAYATTGAIGAVTLRPFNIAGAVNGVGDTDPGRIIPNILRALTGQIPHVTLNGDGSAVRDFVHVQDVADAVSASLTACKPGQHRLYNVGSGIGVSMAQVVAIAEQVTGQRIAVAHNPPKPEPLYLTANIYRIGSELGWQPHRSGLDQVMVEAWQARKN